MEVVTLDVESRSANGTKQVRTLRSTGKIPIVLYGGGKEPLKLQASYNDVKRHLEHHLRVYQLHLGDKMQPGYLQEVQWDCLTDEPMHMDFRRIEMDQPLLLDVELVLLGNPKGTSQGSRLVRDVPHLKLACLPAHVPEQVELRVGHLEPGDKILAREIELPRGCTLDMPEDQQVLHMTEVSEAAPESAEGDAAPADDATPAE